MTIRLSPVVVEYFKSKRPGWQTKVDDVLHEQAREEENSKEDNIPRSLNLDGYSLPLIRAGVDFQSRETFWSALLLRGNAQSPLDGLTLGIEYPAWNSRSASASAVLTAE